MKRNRLLYSAATFAIVMSALTTLYISQRDSAPRLAPTTYAKAKATPSAGKCLEENTSVKLPEGAKENVELSAISYLIDVPAGTNVDVKIASYDSSKVTGSDRYPEAYGSYNFVMEKQNSGWQVTTFQRCD